MMTLPVYYQNIRDITKYVDHSNLYYFGKVALENLLILSEICLILVLMGSDTKYTKLFTYSIHTYHKLVWKFISILANENIMQSAALNG